MSFTAECKHLQVTYETQGSCGLERKSRSSFDRRVGGLAPAWCCSSRPRVRATERDGEPQIAPDGHISTLHEYSTFTNVCESANEIQIVKHIRLKRNINASIYQKEANIHTNICREKNTWPWALNCLYYLQIRHIHMHIQTAEMCLFFSKWHFIQRAAVKVTLSGSQWLIFCHRRGSTVAFCPRHTESLLPAPHVACQRLKLMGSCSLIRDVNNRHV